MTVSRMPDEVMARMVCCEVAAGDVMVQYRRSDRRDYLARISAAEAGSRAPLRSKGPRARGSQASIDDQTKPEWMLIESEFVYEARTGAWREHARIDGVTRNCGWPGRGDAIIVNGTPIRRKFLAERFREAWREYAEPGMRHMLEPAPVLAAAEIVDARSSANGCIECAVRPRNTDLITTPLVSPWAEQWALTVHESTGWIVHAASYLGGEIVVEHEVTIRN